MYKILFIDEEKDASDDFKDYVEATTTKENIEVISEYPLESMEEMLQLIFKLNPDAVISDFMLNEHKTDIKYTVPYNGVNLVKELTSIRENFPCFIMTSYDDHAINESEDVNIVYIKDILHNSEKSTNAKANFLERVENQIIHYKTKIQAAESNLLRLIELRNAGNATIEDETEIIRLDHIVEMAIDKKSSIPEEYKSLSNTDRLEKILFKVDELLKKIDNGE